MFLSEIKNFLRLDEDFYDDDILLESLRQAASIYVENATGKSYDESNELYNLLIKLLINHWYENREAIREGREYNEVPHTLTALLHHIAMCQEFVDKKKEE